MTASVIDQTQIKTGCLTDTQINAANKDGSAATPSLRTLGTGALQACSGADSRLSPPTIVTPPNYIYRFPLTYSSTTNVLVGPTIGTNICADSTNTTTLTMATQGTVSINNNGSIYQMDAFSGPGTCSVTSGLKAVTGVSTSWITSSVFGLRTGAGTITTSGTSVTGSGTAFLSQVAIGDLIGVGGSAGYVQVTAIASDTTLTTNLSLSLSGSSYNIIENPVITIGTNTPSQITQIATDTTLTLSSNASATQSGVTYKVGTAPNLATIPGTNLSWLNLWVGNGGSGTGCYASTQRTTPFGISGYNTYFRRVGSILINAGAITFFSQSGTYNDKWYQWETAATNLLAAGSATSWTPIVCSAWSSPFAQTLRVSCVQVGGVSSLNYLRKRNSGATTTTRNLYAAYANNTGSDTEVICDGAQCIDYVCGAGGSEINLLVFGYQEQL